jgi:heme/copper-type cytochrome/quinol oxidase subunit 4
MCNDWNRDSSFLGNSYETFSVSVSKLDLLVKEHIASEASITVVCAFLDQNLIQIVLSKITFLHMYASKQSLNEKSRFRLSMCTTNIKTLSPKKLIYAF